MIGAGVIGGIFAGHLAQVADVSVLATPRSRRRAQRRRPSHQRTQRARAASPQRRPGRSRAVRRVGIVAAKANGLEAAAGLAGRPLPRRDDRHRAQRARCGGGRARARRLANRLGRHLRLGHEALRHARQYVLDTGPGSGRTRDAVHAGREIGDLIARSASKWRSCRPATRTVVEAHLQRDGQLGRRAARAPAHDHHFADEEAPTDLGHLVHDLVDEGRPSRRRRESSSTTTRGR